MFEVHWVRIGGKKIAHILPDNWTTFPKVLCGADASVKGWHMVWDTPEIMCMTCLRFYEEGRAQLENNQRT